ncbi:helix-turn-helix domain-containing protein [Streptomyces sp. RKAG337]|uniref:helix-turn-helix domain-containing protein n=1 Tax=Streptomyces sp. RKAG337 TaxID=2893404 RepID=UPI0027E4E72C|nr:helix-turn-helix transcriptional regulator [Streptomyces sp. RKAG337]
MSIGTGDRLRRTHDGGVDDPVQPERPQHGGDEVAGDGWGGDQRRAEQRVRVRRYVAAAVGRPGGSGPRIHGTSRLPCGDGMGANAVARRWHCPSRSSGCASAVRAGRESSWPPRNTPTARQAPLGAALRAMREAAGVTARDAARLLGADPAKVSHIEAGRVGVSEERLRRLASFYACGDTALIDSLVSIANEYRGQGWWEQYRGVLPAPLLDLAELEYHTDYLRAIQITHIP